MTGPLFWIITIMTLTLLPIVTVLFLFFLAKWRKNKGLYKSSFKSLWKNKLTIGLVLFFYAFSFGAVSGILVFSQRMMWGVEEVAVDNHASHTSWQYEPTTEGLFSDPAGVSNEAIKDQTDTITYPDTVIGEVDDYDLVSDGLWNLITDTNSPSNGYTYTVLDLNNFIEMNFLNPSLVGDGDSDIEEDPNGDLDNEDSEWNQVYSLYGGQLNFYFVISVMKFVEDWNSQTDNEFQISYSFDMHKVYKPTTSITDNSSYMFMSLNNQDIFSNTNSTIESENVFHSDGTINTNENLIVNEPLFYWVAEENEQGQDGLERLFTHNSDLTDPGVVNDLKRSGTFENPYVVAVNDDWFLANESKFYDSDTSNFTVTEDGTYKFRIDTYYFEVVATFRLPHILYPIQDWTNYVVDTSSQAIFLMNQSQFAYLDIPDLTTEYSLYFGYDNVYSEINSAMDYTDEDIQATVKDNEEKLDNNSGSLHSIFDMPQQYSYYEYLDSFNSARFYVVIFQIEFYVYLAIVLMVLFLIIAVVLIIFFIRKRIKENTKQIGILKSLGYKNSTIALSYLVYPLTIILVGGALAVAFSAFMQWVWILMIGPLLAINLYSFAFTTLATTLIFVIPLALLSFVSIIVTGITLRKKPIDLLSNKEQYQPNILVRSTGVLFAKTKSFTMSYKIKGSFKALGKSTLLFTSIIGATILLTFSFSSSQATQNAIESTSQEFTTNAYAEFSNTSASEYISYTGDAKDELETEYGINSAYTFGLDNLSDYNDDQRVSQDTIDLLLDPNVTQVQKYNQVIDPVIYQIDLYVETSPIIEDANNNENSMQYNFDINYYIDTEYLFYIFELAFWAGVSDSLYSENTISLLAYTDDLNVRPLGAYLPVYEFMFSQALLNYALSPAEYDETNFNYQQDIANEAASTIELVYYNKPQYITFQDSFYSVDEDKYTVPYFNTTFNYLDSSMASQQGTVMVFENTEAITKLFDFSSNENDISQEELDRLETVQGEHTDGVWIIPVIANEKMVESLSNAPFIDEEVINGYQSFEVSLADVSNIWAPALDVSTGSESNTVYIQIVGTYSSPAASIFLTTINHFEADLVSAQSDSSTPGGDSRSSYLWEGYFYLNDSVANDVVTLNFADVMFDDNEVVETTYEDYYLFNDSFVDTTSTQNTTITSSFSSSLIPLIFTNDLLTRQLEEVYSILNLFFVLFALIAMVIAITLVFVAVKDLIDSSRREVAMLKAFGYSNNKATSLVLTPFLLIIAAAYALAIPVTWFVLSLMGSALTTLTGVTIVFPISIPSLLIVGSIIAGISIVIIIMGWFMFKNTNPLEIIGQTNE